MTLFCKETQCQTLICSKCLDKRHLKHEVVDADEYWKHELLDKLISAIQSLSFQKEQIEAVQKKNRKCLKKIKEEKKRTLNLVRDKYDLLLGEASTQIEDSKGQMMSLEENLVLLNNIKQYVRSKTLSLKEVKNCRETVDNVSEHHDHTEPKLYYLEYTVNKDQEQLVEELFGKLSRVNHTTQTSSITGNFEPLSTVLSENVGSRNLREMERANTMSSSPNSHFFPRFQCKFHYFTVMI